MSRVINSCRRLSSGQKSAIIQQAKTLNGRASSQDGLDQLCVFTQKKLGIRVGSLAIRRLINGRGSGANGHEPGCKRRSVRSIHHF